jgi:hypothetical protein
MIVVHLFNILLRTSWTFLYSWFFPRIVFLEPCNKELAFTRRLYGYNRKSLVSYSWTWRRWTEMIIIYYLSWNIEIINWVKEKELPCQYSFWRHQNQLFFIIIWLILRENDKNRLFLEPLMTYRSLFSTHYPGHKYQVQI